MAHLEIRGSDVSPEKLKFLTRSGTEYVPESFNAESGDYILSLVGGKANDGQELYALYPKRDSGYYNLGKLLIYSYPSYSFPVKIVSVGGGLPAGEFSALRQNLEDVFSRYGIRCDVSYDETEYSDLQMFDKGSGLLSAYNSRMKAFNRHYASTRELDEGCSYLFVFPESGYKRNRDFSGFMPRNCQFGYVFRQDFASFNSFCLAVAHELCHGRLSLKHIFDNSYGLSEGDLAENLMDYRDGSHLAKWQWDVIHDPGVVVRIFERDKDAAIQGLPDPICVQKVFERFRAAYVNQNKFVYPATGAPAWGYNANDITLTDGVTYKSLYVKLFQDMDLVPFEFDKEMKKEYWYGKVMQIVVQDNLAEFHSYLFPTRDEWNKQMNDLVSKITNEANRTHLIEMLAILPLSEYNRFSGSEISNILEILLKGSLTEDWISCINEEEILLTLLSNIQASDRKQFLHTFEPMVISLLKKLDGDNRNKALWILSDFIHHSFGGDMNSVTQYYLRSDGSVYNHVFRWSETIGADPLYDLKLSSSSNKILVSVRTDWWFSDNKQLMELSPYDFVGVKLESDLKYRLPSSYQGGGDFLVMPALLFHSLCEERNSDEAWTRFYQGLDLGFTLATLGSYGAAKTALQVGTTYTLGMSLDYMIRLGINSLVEEEFMTAVENTSLLDANWNAATMFISNSKMAVSINFARTFAKDYFTNTISINTLEKASFTLLTTLIANRLFPHNGKYANLLIKKLESHPKIVIAKLRKYGIEKDTLIELIRLLFSSSSQELMEIIKKIDLIYE